MDRAVSAVLDHEEGVIVVSQGATLHLDRSRTARAFDLDESLWEEEITRIFQLVNQHREVVPTMGSGEDAPHLALALYGSYGSGKTSLLKTLQRLVNRPESLSAEIKEELRAQHRELEDSVYCLPILRPNLVTGGESFLYAFLAAVLRVERRLEGKAQLGEDSGRRSGRLFTGVERSLQEVTEHLQVLDESQDGAHHDPIGASVAKLERHASDYELKESLGRLIEQLTNSLLRGERGLLLLPIDDTDLSQESLFETLDSLRRYLEHPRLVPICTFNGRLAEELLVTHFSKELRRREGSRGDEWYKFEVEIALQYMARMFPVRNRIRLGATSVLVQEADYRSGAPHEAAEEFPKVRSLLARGSKVLFGFPEILLEPQIKLALRPTVLRRQLQILDALHDVGIEELFDGRGTKSPDGTAGSGGGESPQGLARTERALASAAWVEAFENATWALLDAHRDVLKELDIHLEDLYGWSPRSLREWILSKIVDLEPHRRSLLLDRWVHRTENRRGQVLSLLAANVFRPPLKKTEQIPGEQALGLWGITDSKQSLYLNSSRLCTWFLNLWLGFYLPQILLLDQQTSGETVSDMPTVGWHLEDAPALAMRQAIKHRHHFGPGTMFLDEGDIARVLRGKKGEKLEKPEMAEFQLAVNLWCFYGYERDQPWCAVSLWRGLSLIGQLLQLRDHEESKGNAPSSSEQDRATPEDTNAAREGDGTIPIRRKIFYLLNRHLLSARLPGSLRPVKKEAGAGGRKARTAGERVYIVAPDDSGRVELDFGSTAEGNATGGKSGNGSGDGREKETYVPFPDYRCDPVGEPVWKELKEEVNGLVEKIKEWLENVETDQDHPYDPLDPVPESVTDEPTEVEDGKAHPLPPDAWIPDEMKGWRECQLRRLHGDDLLGVFWSELEDVYADPERERSGISARNVLRGWAKVVEQYWRENSPVYQLLEGCPILLPARIEPLHALKASPSFPIDFSEAEDETPEDGGGQGEAGEDSQPPPSAGEES